MVSLLIVDDESGTRGGLLNHIDWSKFGVEMIQTAGSAQEALHICETFTPDLILSDIRMRGMNGIEMCMLLHKQFPLAQIIFISGYSDKEYLKAAIEIGAVNYVEKPVNLQEVERAVEKACQIIDEKRKQKSYDELLSGNSQYMRRSVFLSLLSGNSDFGDGLAAQAESFRFFDEARPCFRVAVLRMSRAVTNINQFYRELAELVPEETQTGETAVFHEFRDNRTLIFLFSGTAEALADGGQLISDYGAVTGKKRDEPHMFMAIGKTVSQREKISEAYKDALKVLETLFYWGYGHTRMEKREDNAVRIEDGLEDAFIHAVSERSIGGTQKLLEDVREQLVRMQAIKGSPVRRLYYAFFDDLVLEYERLFTDKGDQLVKKSEEMYQGFEEADTLEEINRQLLTYIRELFEATNREESGSSVIAQLTRIIGSEFGSRDMSVKMLADRVYLTPTYLSGLFKRKTGKTIGEYITCVRIEKAKSLLYDKQLKLYHISEKVGYEDANYFAKIFKRHTGLTPSEYREKIL